MFFFLTYGDGTLLRHAPQKVTSDCAVSLEVDDCTRRWVVIEDDKPVPSRREFSVTSELALRLLGREVGDVVELPGNLVRSEKATLRELQTKYVRAFQDSLEHYRERFPDTSFLQQIPVGSGDDFDPTPIVESLKQRHEGIERCIEIYKTSACPLHLFASRIGISELDAVKALAQHPNGIVKCCQTTPQEFEQAVGQGVASAIIVLDISAIVTLTLLDGWSALDPTKQYMVSQTTKELVDQWVSDASGERAHELGRMAVTDDNHLLVQETTVEQQNARRAEREKMKKMVETHCAWRSSESMAALPPEKRRVYEQVAGFHNVEAMSLAKNLNAVLWSDDLVLSFIAKADFDVKSVWTQLAVRCFVDAGLVSINDFNLVSTKLASWDYATIVWNPQTIIALASMRPGLLRNGRSNSASS